MGLKDCGEMFMGFLLVCFFLVGFHALLIECMNGFCSFDCGEMFRFLSLSSIHTRFYIVLKGWDLFNLISCAH